MAVVLQFRFFFKSVYHDLYLHLARPHVPRVCNSYPPYRHEPNAELSEGSPVRVYDVYELSICSVKVHFRLGTFEEQLAWI